MTLRGRVLSASAAALVCLALVAGCSDDDGDAGKGTPTTAPSTTAAGGSTASSTSTDPSETSVAGDSSDSTASSVPDTSDEGPEGSGEPEEEAADVSWELDAVEYRGRDGLRVAYDCPADGTVGSVWGTGTYTDDSSVCSAAVHAGLITVADGGRVVVEIEAGQETYEGTESHGVTSNDYGAWQGSFSFPAS